MDSATSDLVRQRAGNRCEYCRLPHHASALRFRIEHIVARQHGGTDDASNLALACPECNFQKGDGSDVVMLSGETSVGKYPVETIKMMNEIIINAEHHYFVNENIKFQVPEAFEENLFDSVLKGITSVAEQIKANAIVVFTYKGRAARGLAKFRPAAKIIAISDSFETMNNLCLRWGVDSLFINKIDKQNAAVEEAKNLILNAGLVNNGELVIFLSRAPFSEKGRSDFLHFEVL